MKNLLKRTRECVVVVFCLVTFFSVGTAADVDDAVVKLDGMRLQIEYWQEELDSLASKETCESIVDCYYNMKSLLDLVSGHIDAVKTLVEHGEPDW